MFKLDGFPPITEEQRRKIFQVRPGPVFDLLGMRLDEVEPGHARLSMPFSKPLTHAGGFVQGGIITALADATVAFALYSVLDNTRQDQTSIDIKMNFIRPGAGDLWAEGWLLHLGSRTAVGESMVYNMENKPVAKCLSTVMLVENDYMATHNPDRG